MEYYLLPVEDGKEAVAVEEALKKIDYDVDDRAYTWTNVSISYAFGNCSSSIGLQWIYSNEWY